MQYRYIFLSVKMKNIYLYSLQNSFLLVSKACTNKLLIFQQCILVYIVYIFSVLVSLCSLAISEKISSYFSKSGAYLRWQSYWMSDSSELWHFIRTINISFWKIELKIEMVQFFLIRIFDHISYQQMVMDSGFLISCQKKNKM